MKSRRNLYNSFLEADADVIADVSIKGNRLYVHTNSRHDPSVNVSVKLSDAERQLIKEMSRQ